MFSALHFVTRCAFLCAESSEQSSNEDEWIKNDISERCRILHNEEINDLYRSSSIPRIKKSGRQ
jgi:hypothetical protein